MRTTNMTPVLLTSATLVFLLLRVKEAEGARPEAGDEELSPGTPSFRNTPKVTTVRQGDTATLKCSVKNLGTKNVIWRRKDELSPLTVGKKLFVDDKRFKVQHRSIKDRWNLVIQDVRLDDGGQYECQVSTTTRGIRRYVTLNVTRSKVPVKVKEKIEISGKTAVDKSSQIRLVCNATGTSQSLDDLDWFFNGQKLISEKDDKITISKRLSLMEKTIYSVLEVKDVDMKDAGIYVCRTSDLQVASERVDVLNAGTNNVKRENLNERKKGKKLENGSSKPSVSKEQTSNTESVASSHWPPPSLQALVWLVAWLCRRDLLELPT